MDKRSKIRGCLYGMAVGDALGIGTEFMTRQEIRIHYPDGLTHYDRFIRDAHRSQWERGDWSNDTEILLLITENIVKAGKYDVNAVKAGIKEWFDSNPHDMTDNMRWLKNNEQWYEDPIRVTHEITEKSRNVNATNEAIGRGLILAMVSDNLLEDVKESVLLTHDNSLCVGTASIIAHAARELFQNGTEPSYDKLKWIANQYNRAIVRYLDIAKNGSIEEFDLDDMETIWFSRKSMGAALWTMWHCGSVEEALHTVLSQGGDTNTNASLACGLLGLKYGDNDIPQYLIDGLTQKERLETVADQLYDLIESK